MILQLLIPKEMKDFHKIITYDIYDMIYDMIFIYCNWFYSRWQWSV